MTTLFAAVEDKVTKEPGIVVAFVYKHPRWLVVSLRENGATRFYCVDHKRLFRPKDTCPECTDFFAV